jgi:penicillin V acylase-like amidase (Ntn superfamily)
VSFYGVATAYGMNEKGLVAHLAISDPSGDTAIFEDTGHGKTDRAARAGVAMLFSRSFSEVPFLES